MATKTVEYVLSALLFILVPCLALAQTAGTGALSGTLTDQTGPVEPNAQVTVTSIGTGQVRSTTTRSPFVD